MKIAAHAAGRNRTDFYKLLERGGIRILPMRARRLYSGETRTVSGILSPAAPMEDESLRPA